MQNQNEEQFSKSIEIENDWVRLGRKSTRVEVRLTDAEKIELGQKQTEALYRLEELEDELTKFKATIKDKSAASRLIIKECAIFLKSGIKTVTKDFPCFYDPRSNLRLFIDPATGEIAATTPADPDDRQLRMAD